MNIREEYIKAGKIASEVRDSLRKDNLLGKRLLDVCKIVEERIKQKGAKPAFPCNICLNEIAAHYTPSPKDTTVIKEGDVVKIDIGVQVDGFIADTAITLGYNSNYDLLILATEKALKKALKVVRNEVKISDIGRAVESTALIYNFKPISNLSGHSIEQYIIHAGKSIPNVWVPSTQTLKKGEICAIEPFLTTKEGAGSVKDAEYGNIYALIARKRLKDKRLNDLIEILWENFKTLPFTPRWLLKYYDDYDEVSSLILQLFKSKVVRAYPILKEAKGGIVAQAEHTIALTEEGCIILTE
ncbi:MAG: type II methionyl aminopeptidase [Nitrososphaerales archaeon]